MLKHDLRAASNRRDYRLGGEEIKRQCSPPLCGSKMLPLRSPSRSAGGQPADGQAEHDPEPAVEEVLPIARLDSWSDPFVLVLLNGDWWAEPAHPAACRGRSFHPNSPPQPQVVSRQ
jgi:hypothetical protein